MDDDNHTLLSSRKSECRVLFKKCFKNNLFSLVPFEIWRDLIVSNADPQSISVISQTCWGFKEIVDFLGSKNLDLALVFRNEGQIVLAKKYLFKCAENDNSVAMLHLGYSYFSHGWGLKGDHGKAVEWFKKSAELGNAHAMAFYSCCLKNGIEVNVSHELGDLWGKKAFYSNISFAVGYCYLFGLETEVDYHKACSSFEASAKEGDEFGQYWFGYCFHYEFGAERDYKNSLYWFLKSAEMGLCISQLLVGTMYRDGLGCTQDNQKAIIWFKKAAKQGDIESRNELEKMRIKIF